MNEVWCSSLDTTLLTLVVVFGSFFLSHATFDITKN